MTDNSDHTSSSVAQFYDELAAQYDEMTGFEKRFIKEKPFFHLLVDRYRIKSALDAGCGTGFHSLLLSQLGVSVTAIDVSPNMLQQVRRHAREFGLSVKTVESRFEGLRERAPGPFDAVMSLGNTLAHLLSLKSLKAALENFFDILRPGGIFVVQMLNYDRILASREPLQSTRKGEEKTFIRYYDFKETSLLFNVLTLTGKNGEATQDLRTIELRPVRSEELSDAVARTGFADIRLYGAISLEDFSREISNDLVVIARRPEKSRPAGRPSDVFLATSRHCVDVCPE